MSAWLAVAGLAASTACAPDPPDAPMASSVVATAATSAPPIAPATTPAITATPPVTADPIDGTTSSTTEPPDDPAQLAVALTTIGTFRQPVDLAWRADDPTLFVVEQAGIIVAWRNGTTGTPVLDITELTDAAGEQGLLGLAFSPEGSTAFVNHTDLEGDTVVAEYAVGADGIFAADSRRVLLTVEQPYANHNGGNVTIGPDGLLYIGMGDGGSADDPQRVSLNLVSLLGKILRIDPTPSAGSPYTVPADNPFVDVDGARPEIWSIGLRNPWRFAFDRDTGDLWIADVGQNEREEINVSRASDGAGRGFNFGWSAFEGTRRFNEDQSAAWVTPPVYEYEHGDAGCSVSGGAVYRGDRLAALDGWYVFSDYCSGVVTALRASGASVETRQLAEAMSVTAVREGPDGELYVLSMGGDVSRLDPA